MHRLGGVIQHQLYVGAYVRQSRFADERGGMTHDVICQGFRKMSLISRIPLPNQIELQ